MRPGNCGNLGNVGNVESVTCTPYYPGDETNPPSPLLLLKWEHLKSERLRLRSWTSVRGGSDKHLPAIRQRHFRAICHFRSILGAIAGDRDLIAHFQGILLPPCPPQNQRRAEFDIPIRHGAAFILHVYIETGMRVHPLYLRDDSGELYRIVLVILSRKGMVRKRRPRERAQTQAGEQETHRNSSHR